jgi:hypothetical protein
MGKFKGIRMRGLVVLLIAACHPKPPRSIVEVPATSPVTDDPAQRGVWSQELRLPPSAVSAGEHDFPPYASVDASRFTLPPATAKDVPVAITGPSLVVTQAIGFGSAEDIELSITANDAPVATAKTVRLPPDRTEAAAAAAVAAGSTVTVHVANQGAHPVDVRLVVEVAPKTGGV